MDKQLSFYQYIGHLLLVRIPVDAGSAHYGITPQWHLQTVPAYVWTKSVVLALQRLKIKPTFEVSNLTGLIRIACDYCSPKGSPDSPMPLDQFSTRSRNMNMQSNLPDGQAGGISHVNIGEGYGTLHGAGISKTCENK